MAFDVQSDSRWGEVGQKNVRDRQKLRLYSTESWLFIRFFINFLASPAAADSIIFSFYKYFKYVVYLSLLPVFDVMAWIQYAAIILVKSYEVC